MLLSSSYYSYYSGKLQKFVNYEQKCFIALDTSGLTKHALVTVPQIAFLSCLLTFSKMAFTRMTFSIVAFYKMAYSGIIFRRMTINRMTFSRMKFNRTIFSRVAFSRLTFSSLSFSRMCHSTE